MRLSAIEKKHQLRWNEAPRSLKQLLKEIEQLKLGKVELKIKNKSLHFDSEKKNIDKLLLQNLKPWRKGPFWIANQFIDTEWDCEIKYQLIKEILNRPSKKILDIGANNAWYQFRFWAENNSERKENKEIIAIDPTYKYYLQYKLLRQFVPEIPLKYYLAGWQDISLLAGSFDLILCMGILYHHTDPLAILKTIQQSLAKGGQVILETQGIAGEQDICLFPRRKYAGAKGMYFLPTVNCLKNWIRRANFNHLEVMDIHKLSGKEQRATAWSQEKSLENYLNPDNDNETIEGYPAPVRMVFLIKK